MKRIRVNKGFVGLVFKNDDYQRIVTAGKHWLNFGEEVRYCNKAKLFGSEVALEVFLEDEHFRAQIELIEVPDGCLTLVFQNGNYWSALDAGRHVFWKGLVHRTYVTYDMNSTAKITEVTGSLLKTIDIQYRMRVFEVASYERGLLFINDEFCEELEPGIHRFWQNEAGIRVLKTDVRTQQMEVSGQELLTKDKAMIRVNFFVNYQVVALKTALLKNKEFERQLYVAAQLKLRSFLGGYTLDEVLEKKEELGAEVFEALREVGDALGVELLDTGIRDVILTGEMKEIMNQVLVAQKAAQANSITRREETAATRSLLNTAKLMEENSMLFALKEMEYVEKIASKIGAISVAGNSNVLAQLKDVFTVTK